MEPACRHSLPRAGTMGRADKPAALCCRASIRRSWGYAFCSPCCECGCCASACGRVCAHDRACNRAAGPALWHPGGTNNPHQLDRQPSQGQCSRAQHRDPAAPASRAAAATGATAPSLPAPATSASAWAFCRQWGRCSRPAGTGWSRLRAAARCWIPPAAALRGLWPAGLGRRARVSTVTRQRAALDGWRPS